MRVIPFNFSSHLMDFWHREFIDIGIVVFDFLLIKVFLCLFTPTAGGKSKDDDVMAVVFSWNFVEAHTH